MKLAKEDKARIRRLYKSGNYSMTELAKMYDVSKTSIFYVLNASYRERLKHYHKEHRKTYISKKVLKDLVNKLEWLESHNKNYTKEQYYKIQEILDVVNEYKGV